MTLRRFELTDHERDSALWKKLREQAEDQLDALRRDNDRNHDEVRTANIRGQIARLNIFLALGKPAPHQETDDG